MPLETFLLIVAFVFGCAWGSFFNVAIYRLPHAMSILRPGSHCFSCNAPIAWYDNIPLISWLVLRGKCRRCGAPFSFRYFVVELLSGLLFTLVMRQYVGTVTTKGLALAGAVAVVLHWFMIGGFVVLTFIDFDHKIIPDAVTIPGIVLGLVASFAVPTLVARYPANAADVSRWSSLLQGAIGAAVGAGIIYVISVGGKALFKKEAMGGGDLKLMAMIGAYTGWQLVLLVLFLSTLAGSIVGVTLIIISQRRGARLIRPLQQTAENDPDPQARAKAQSEIEEIQGSQTAWSSQIPFGPYIVLGALIAFFLGPKLIHWYFGFFHRAPEALSSLF